jgi:Family of unknown function (DUF6516)
MKAELLQRQRYDFDDGSILEMVIWRVSKPVPGSPHSYRYRLYYGSSGKRLIGYGNQRPKGDHRHVAGREEPYLFTDVESLVRDFLADVAHRGSQ